MALLPPQSILITPLEAEGSFTPSIINYEKTTNWQTKVQENLESNLLPSLKIP